MTSNLTKKAKNLLKRAVMEYPKSAVIWDFKNTCADGLDSLYLAGLIEEPRITNGSL